MEGHQRFAVQMHRPPRAAGLRKSIDTTCSGVVLQHIDNGLLMSYWLGAVVLLGLTFLHTTLCEASA